jgi:glutamate mutase epsilon subunit
MMLPPSRSAAFMGLFSENALEINREVLGPYQGNVDQITG